MKINLMTHYAVKTIKSIALNGGNIVTSTYISEDQGIPHGVLMKVLRHLRICNIVESHQGRGEISGGYSLLVSVKEITLLNIIEIMEGPIEGLFFACLKNMETGKSGQSTHIEPESIGLEQEYRRISEILKMEMNRFTIAELLQVDYPEQDYPFILENKK